MSTHITNWIRAYHALLDHAGSLRGLVVLNPGTIDVERWPHTTGADVIVIAALVDPTARACDRYGTARRWKTACAAIDPIALREPTTAYPHNRAFWRALASAFVDLHAADVPVLPEHAWGALFGQLGELARYRNDTSSPPFGPFPGVMQYGDLYRAQIKAIDQLRGTDKMDAPAGHGFGGAGMMIPRATNADVRALADYWSKALPLAKEIPGYDFVNTKWREVLADVDALTATGNPADLYPKNNEFFRELPNVSNKLNEIAIRAGTETNVNDFIESLVESAKHLPENIGKAIDYVGEHVSKAAGKTAHAAGEVLNEVGRGALSGLGTPILIGAAGIAGLLLLTRRGGGEDKEA